MTQLCPGMAPRLLRKLVKRKGKQTEGRAVMDTGIYERSRTGAGDCEGPTVHTKNLLSKEARGKKTHLLRMKGHH